MSFQTVSRKQLGMLGYCVEDFVPKKSKCRFVVDLVSELDLSALYCRYSDKGAEAKDPSAMLAIWFFAYTEGESSTRSVETKCRFDTRYMYLSGILMPDHSTLSRFRQKNLDLMEGFFVEILHLAKEKGISDFKSIAIDGSKIQASASIDKSKTADKLSRYLEAVRKDITQYMHLCDQGDLLETDEQNESLDSVRTKLEKLQELEKTLLERKEQLEVRKEDLKQDHRQGHQINLTEPDARIMRNVNGKQNAPGYNVQIGVDTSSHFIVSNDVVTSTNDFHQFATQHQIVEKNLGQDKQRTFDLDSGYHSLDALEYKETNQIDAVIADSAPENRSCKDTLPDIKELLNANKPLNREHFIYHSEQDYYECPPGHKLLLKSELKQQNKYQSNSDDCSTCALRSLCFSRKNKSGIRTILRSHREKYAENMYLELQTDEAKKRLKGRATSVEPVFGNLKSNMGFRRFKLRGLQKVKGEFTLMCIAHNINKLFQFSAELGYDSTAFAKEYLAKVDSSISKNLSKAHSIVKRIFQIRALLSCQ